MKQCPRCSRNYTDETLVYCLEDGTLLVRARDSEATMINPYPPAPIVPPTAAYQMPPFNQPVTPAMFAPAASVPPARHRSPWAVGALVLVALAVGLTIGGIIFQRSSSTTADPPAVAAVNPAATSTTTSGHEAGIPTPPQQAVQTTTPSSNSQDSTVAQEQECVLYNDRNDKSVINVRMNCDTRNCDTDPSTIVDEYPDNTPIRVISGASVAGTRFRWVKIIITSSGQTVWVASTKIKCA
jgi:hypothetical protein